MRTKEGEKVHIKIFITKNRKFRAKISIEGKPPYEVTVNGNSWKQGVGQPFQEEILDRCRSIVKNLSDDLKIIEHNSIINKTTPLLDELEKQLQIYSSQNLGKDAKLIITHPDTYKDLSKEINDLFIAREKNAFLAYRGIKILRSLDVEKNLFKIY